MNQHHADFRYRSLPEIPREFRQVDWTFVDAHDKPFAEGEEAFRKLREEYREVFADKPFAYLNFLRAVESRLLSLAVLKRQPISKCLEYLRRRLDLEYNRVEIYSKAAQLVVLANYAAECGETELARRLLKEEHEELQETQAVCRSWLETIAERIDRLTA
jgi:hypothetical protein